MNVTTSDIRGAGTNANVYIQLFGEHNDTGDFWLTVCFFVGY